MSNPYGTMPNPAPYTRNGTRPSHNGTWSNDTWPPNSTWQMPEGHPIYAWGVSPTASYIIAICYLGFLCLIAIAMCVRARTRLRAFACLLTYLGLTISVLGVLRTQRLVSPNWFWAWNFLAEGIAVTALCFTIVSVGSGFYPMTNKRNIYWTMTVGVIIFYAMTALANAVYYIQQRVVRHSLSGAQVTAIRNEIVKEGIFTMQELIIMTMMDQRSGIADSVGDIGETGVSSWRGLPWAERTMYARPNRGVYLVHQFIMLSTCTWCCFYLFVPLILHHRRGPVGRPVDSDMLAIGVWYLTCLVCLASALDLCVRCTCGPIFLIPAPRSLLRFYRNHFNASNTSGPNDSISRHWSPGRTFFRGDSSNNTNSHGNSFTSPASTRIGTQNENAARDSLDFKYQEPANFGRIKLFNARAKGQSMESSRVLSRDFDCESINSIFLSEDQPESYHQFCSSLDSNRHPLHRTMIDDEESTVKSQNAQQKDELIFNLQEPQQPKPALTEQRMGPLSNSAFSSRKDIELVSMNFRRETKHEESEYEQTSIDKDSEDFALAMVDTPIEELTGLQRQLAEHRSELLPKAIAFKAYHDNLVTDEPFDPSNVESSEIRRGPSGSRPGSSRPSRTFIRQQSEDRFAAAMPIQNGGVELERMSSSDSVNRSTLKAPSRDLSETSGFFDSNSNIASDKPRDNKVKEGFMSTISKSLTPGGNHGSSSNNRASIMPETNRAPVIATVEELAQRSIMGSEKIDNRINSSMFPDPYESQGGFDSRSSSAPSLGSTKSQESLSKSGLDSKDFQKKLKSSSSSSSSRKSRSKSDEAYQEIPQVSKSKSSNTFAHPPLPSPTPIVEPHMVTLPITRSSLSPPPRQRSKSSKSSIPAVANGDTSRTNEYNPTTRNTLPSASDANPSSPLLQSSSANNVASSPEESYTQRATSSSYNNSRVSRERERTVPLSPSSGHSPRMNNNLHQRSVDNLASAYYYKRASELNAAPGRSSTFTSSSQYSQAGSPTQSARQPRDLNGIAIPSSLYSPSMSPTLGSPSSPGIRSAAIISGYVDSYGYGRGSTSPTLYGRGGSSSSMTTAESRHHKNGSISDLYRPDIRSNSLTSSYGSQSQAQNTHAQNRLLAEDPWTQAMVNRAQATTAKSSNEPEKNRTANPTVYSESVMRPSVGRTTSG
ncbi:hypothetical protein BGZ49_009709 [Haplosporangium sp. Z 27]|nr:hypothetical protein BGZ49_009709 [Haplosporangium sp. Z 27]